MEKVGDDNDDAQQYSKLLPSHLQCTWLIEFCYPISYGSEFCNWGQGNLGPCPLFRPNVLVPNLCHVDHHVGCEEIWVGPQYTTLGPIFIIPSSPIGRNLDDLDPPCKVLFSESSFK
jgi:hypothetical protein